MASIQERDGKFRVQIRYKNVSRSGTFSSYREAERWAALMEKMIDDGEYCAIPRISFKTLFDRYLREVSPNKASCKKENQFFARLEKYPLASKKLDELNEADFQRWRDARLKEVKVGTLLREWSILSNLLKVAVNEWRILPRNYLKGIKKPSEPLPRTQRWSQDNIDLIVQLSGFDWNEPLDTLTKRVALAFLFAIATAMRAGEICGLTWENVHLTSRVAHLPKTKNGHSRDVPLSRDALRILEKLEQEKIGKEVFGMNVNQLAALFRKLKNKALLTDLHFHDTRREALTRLSRKVDVMTLAKISGHRDLSILQNTYYAPRMSEVADLLD